MKIGGMVATKIDDWQIFPEMESLGFDHGWAPDSQMIWSDAYATLALAAHHTSRIRLGTGVAIAGTRLAPVTAHSIASINRLAPGRTFLGIGTGHTAMRVMGARPVKAKAFRDYLRVVRGLLQGQEVEHELNGETRPIRFLDRELECLNLDDPVPIYVGANGPKALKAAGAYGDGRICAGNEPLGVLARNLDTIREGAAEAGREVTDDFHVAALTFSCVLKPGETLESERVIDHVDSAVVSTLHYWYELYQEWGRDDFVSSRVRGVWEDYRSYVETSMPAERRHQMLHRGHCAFCPPEERRFITPDMIRIAGGLVGEPDEIVERIGQLQAAGLKEVTLLPPRAFMRENFREFAEQIMPRL
ncbi:MAG: 5,10-methylenetetrahydromethanopterin reductase [Minwuia thermotolerans]|nr:MAG: 5,10-methylenetetrahydromethanopterin reductase [Minwuia thermotolerans]